MIIKGTNTGYIALEKFLESEMRYKGVVLMS